MPRIDNPDIHGQHDGRMFEETDSESGSCHSSCAVLAECGLVPSPSADEQVPTTSVGSKFAHTNHIAALELAVDKPKLEAIRLGCLKRKRHISDNGISMTNAMNIAEKALVTRSHCIVRPRKSL
jgi:hypothetical protein